jgi:Bacteriocin-protection, YdeI or OmpD-Associated
MGLLTGPFLLVTYLSSPFQIGCSVIWYTLPMTKQAVTTDFMHRIPSDLNAVLKSNRDVLTLWEKLTPLARNEWICWVTIVKKKETRTEHLKRLCEDLQNGKRRPCCWPGCPHRRPSALKYFSKNLKG